MGHRSTINYWLLQQFPIFLLMVYHRVKWVHANITLTSLLTSFCSLYGPNVRQVYGVRILPKPCKQAKCVSLARNVFHSSKKCFTRVKRVSLALALFTNKLNVVCKETYIFNCKKIPFKYETKLFQVQNNSTTVKNCHVTFGTILLLSRHFWQ